MDHVEPALLEAFVRGDLGEHTAAVVALHLDACPACARRASEADPLTPILASVADPPLPQGLVQAILDAATRPPVVVPWAELGVAGALLAASGVGAWRAVTLDAWWGQVHSLARSAALALEHLPAAPGLLSALALLATLAALGSAAGARPTPGGPP